MNTINRLQFRHHGIGSGYTTVEGVFETRDEAIEYIFREVKYAEEGLASVDASYGLSLFGEPTVLRYKNEDDETDPHVILAIGSVTNEDEGKRHSKNRFCIIDTHKTESDIDNLQEQIDELAKLVKVIAKSSDTLDLYAEQTDSGTVISGDVRVAEYHVFDRIAEDNHIMKTDDGLFMFVDVDYDENTSILNFTVNDTTKAFKITGNDVVSGIYNPQDESLRIRTRFGDEITINLEELLAEWVVEGEATKSPIVLTRKEVGYDEEVDHHHVEPWQDILSADVRIADERVNNILKKTIDNRYLYVDGEATNIVYYSSTGKTNVQQALDELSSIRISTDSNNIITSKADGFFASTKLEYISSENTLVFTTSTNDEEERKKETRIQLNSFKLFDDIYYEAATESLVILYTDGNGKQQKVKIPIGEMMDSWEWEPQNEGHNVFIDRTRIIHGSDKVSADVKILRADDNILVDNNHMLYVKGTADNIKYGRNSNVEDEIDALKASDATINGKIDTIEGNVETLTSGLAEEVERASNEETRIEGKLDSEIERATAKDTEHDGKIQAIEDEIGDGFGSRNTVRDEIDALQGEVEALSGETASKIADINSNNSINIDKSVPTTPNISVALSQEDENIIKLNNDGLYANVDLDYIQEANKLVFHKSDGSADKVIQLESMSSIISIAYNPTKEAIVITYLTNGHEVKTVEIPVGDLIDEWRVEEGHPNAVQLEKIRVASGTSAQDILKASVVISDAHSDNILVNDNGALYVSGEQIVANSEDIAALDVRMTQAENNMATVDGKINNETVRATSAETALQTAINTEATDRANADSNLSHLLDDEKNRALGAENNITAALNAEVTRATAAETNNANDITTEVTRATSKENEIATNLASEIARATAAEQALDDKIDNVADDAYYTVNSTNTVELIKADEAMGSSITANLKISAAQGNNIKADADGVFSTVDLTYDSTSNKLTFKTTNDEKVISLVSNSIVDRVYYNASEEKIVIEYTVNGQRMEDVEVPVRDLINEIDVASTTTVELIKTVNTSTGADIITANVKLNAVHEDNILVNDGGLYVSGAQIETNKNNIAQLTTNLASTDANVSNLSTSLSNEIVRSTAKDTEIENALNGEIARATNKDNELAQSIANEVVRATAAEGNNADAIAELANNTSSDVNDLRTAITEEKNRALNAETNLNTALSAAIEVERVRATSAETALNTAIETEKTRAMNAEQALDAKIDAKTFEVTSEDSATLDLTVTDGSKISGNVLVANGNGNIIKAAADSSLGTGLFASVDLSYDAATNKLKLTTSASEKEIALSIGSILKSITYDPIAKNLIITYDVNTAGEIHEETIFVPVEDLFNDWTVQEGQHLGAIILHKTEGVSGAPDVLSAEVVLSTLNDNMLINDQGALYVSKAPIDQISGDVADLREDFIESLAVEDTKTIHLERRGDNTLKGDVKLDNAVEGKNLIKETDNGLMFDGNIDCGEY